VKPLLVGEQNPYGPDPEFALYPQPRGCAGWRLCHTILGMTAAEYLRIFDRMNLCNDPWRAWDAEAKVGELLLTPAPKILLGAKVSWAFDVPFSPFEQTWFPSKGGRGPLLVLPHPSGRCRIWNERGSVAKARKAVLEFLT
jgi:hypothetical protein